MVSKSQTRLSNFHFSYLYTHMFFSSWNYVVLFCSQVIEEQYTNALMCCRQVFTPQNCRFPALYVQWSEMNVKEKLKKTFINSKLHRIMARTVLPENVFCYIKELNLWFPLSNCLAKVWTIFIMVLFSFHLKLYMTKSEA